MSPRSRRRLEILRDVEALMTTVGDDGLAPLQAVAERLAELFASAFTIHRMRPSGPGLVPEFYTTGNLDQRQMGAYFDLVARGQGAPSYSWLRPSGPEQNVALTRRELRLELSPRYDKVLRMLGAVQFQAHDQLRVLLCDGPLLLAWCGGLRQEPFRPADKRLLQHLVPILLGPLTHGRRLRDAMVEAAGLAATLDALAAPTFIADRAGAVAHANRVGAALYDHRRLEVREEIARQTAERRAREIRVDGQPAHFLVMLEDTSFELERRLDHAAQVWTLSPRQREVLGQVVRGLSTKHIAAKVGGAEVTVELHLTALFHRAGAPTRAGLISRFWML